MIIWFEKKYGFLSCGGAVDGLDIQILAPVELHDCYNRSGIHSFCKGLIYCFTDVYSEGMVVYKIHVYAHSPLKTISTLQTTSMEGYSHCYSRSLCLNKLVDVAVFCPYW